MNDWSVAGSHGVVSWLLNCSCITRKRRKRKKSGKHGVIGDACAMGGTHSSLRRSRAAAAPILAVTVAGPEVSDVVARESSQTVEIIIRVNDSGMCMLGWYLEENNFGNDPILAYQKTEEVRSVAMRWCYSLSNMHNRVLVLLLLRNAHDLGNHASWFRGWMWAGFHHHHHFRLIKSWQNATYLGLHFVPISTSLPAPRPCPVIGTHMTNWPMH